LSKFIELGLTKLTAAVLEEAEFVEPTEIQVKTIPQVLAGKDVMGSAQTGSGKTAAYALPIIETLRSSQGKPRALILAPTRELALQVEGEFKRFGKNTGLRTVSVYGGTGYHKQEHALRRGVDVIVATPGRLMDYLERKTVDLSFVKVLVLDEADRLMDMGFAPQIRKIVAKVPKERQTLMFSATFEGPVARIAADYLIDPVTIRVNSKQVQPKDIDQRIYHINEFGKDALLLKLIQEETTDSVLVFTRTRRRATWVKSRLRDSNVNAEEIHGDISQSQRERTIARYRAGAFRVLVATDVAARGLDIPSISHVINYDLPDCPSDYVHRIGRTGRAGRAGIAMSFVGEGQKGMVRDIQKVMGQKVDPQTEEHKSAPLRPRRFRTGKRRATAW
jgi:ATP-dependent RNA helicase RhlE